MRWLACLAVFVVGLLLLLTMASRWELTGIRQGSLEVLGRMRGQELVRYEDDEVRCMAIWPVFAFGSSIDCEWKKPKHVEPSFLELKDGGGVVDEH